MDIKANNRNANFRQTLHFSEKNFQFAQRLQISKYLKTRNAYKLCEGERERGWTNVENNLSFQISISNKLNIQQQYGASMARVYTHTQQITMHSKRLKSKLNFIWIFSVLAFKIKPTSETILSVKKIKKCEHSKTLNVCFFMFKKTDLRKKVFFYLLCFAQFSLVFLWKIMHNKWPRQIFWEK